MAFVGIWIEIKSRGRPTHATVRLLAMWDLGGLGRKDLGSLGILNSNLAFLMIITEGVYVSLCVKVDRTYFI